MALKPTSKYRCKNCGRVATLAEVLNPPKDGQPAEDKPCPCGAKDWEPVKG